MLVRCFRAIALQEFLAPRSVQDVVTRDRVRKAFYSALKRYIMAFLKFLVPFLEPNYVLFIYLNYAVEYI